MQKTGTVAPSATDDVPQVIVAKPDPGVALHGRVAVVVADPAKHRLDDVIPVFVTEHVAGVPDGVQLPAVSFTKTNPLAAI